MQAYIHICNNNRAAGACFSFNYILHITHTYYIEISFQSKKISPGLITIGTPNAFSTTRRPSGNVFPMYFINSSSGMSSYFGRTPFALLLLSVEVFFCGESTRLGCVLDTPGLEYLLLLLLLLLLLVLLLPLTNGCVVKISHLVVPSTTCSANRIPHSLCIVTSIFRIN